MWPKYNICYLNGMVNEILNYLFVIITYLLVGLWLMCRHNILYPLQLGPPFFYDGSTLKPKVGLGPNQMKIDLMKVFVENLTYFWKTIFGKERLLETLECAHAYTCMHTHTQAMRIWLGF